jgi:hypothetical protein
VHRGRLLSNAPLVAIAPPLQASAGRGCCVVGLGSGLAAVETAEANRNCLPSRIRTLRNPASRVARVRVVGYGNHLVVSVLVNMRHGWL